MNHIILNVYKLEQKSDLIYLMLLIALMKGLIGVNTKVVN